MANEESSDQTSQVPEAQQMVTAQVDCSADEALVLLNARASATGLRLEEVAVAVVAHRTQFRHAVRATPATN
jgi:hypothetical protein